MRDVIDGRAHDILGEVFVYFLILFKPLMSHCGGCGMVEIYTSNISHDRGREFTMVGA